MAVGDDELAAGLRAGWFGGAPSSYWLTRWLLLRGLGFVYGVAFLILALQGPALIGSHGILPAERYLRRIAPHTSAWQWPTLFWIDASDTALSVAWYIGLGLSIAVLAGAQNAAVMALLWVVYLSFCHVGQVFYGYGWEILLLEAGFLGIFLCPLRSFGSRAASPPPALPAIWMYRWLVFRVMFGAGLIKLRGDACWRDLTCLVFHYETQPIPNPLSWLLHQAPPWFHRLGTAWNHLVELFVPFLVLGPRRARHIAGVVLVTFQVMLILSGNLSFLNWLTIVVCVSCFDDGLLSRIAPHRLRELAVELARTARPSALYRWTVGAVGLLMIVLSVDPVANMLSSRQAMNASFGSLNLHLCNSYGAFGSVSRLRREVVLEGTRDRDPGPGARWLEYELPCKPGSPTRRPCVITPYHYRLDWQMWFAALGDIDGQPWLVHLSYRLLHGDRAVLGLFARNPFGSTPPRFVRASYYEYRFTRLGERSDAWWVRKRLGEYMRPLSLDDPALMRFVEDAGVLPAAATRARLQWRKRDLRSRGDESLIQDR